MDVIPKRSKSYETEWYVENKRDLKTWHDWNLTWLSHLHFLWHNSWLVDPKPDFSLLSNQNKNAYLPHHHFRGILPCICSPCEVYKWFCKHSSTTILSDTFHRNVNVDSSDLLSTGCTIFFLYRTKAAAPIISFFYG